MLLVSFIMLRREAKESAEADPWQDHNIAMLEAGAEPLPESVPDSLKGGQILDFGFLPDRDNAGQRVWLLRFKDSYPNVRLVQDVESGEVEIMAADQIKVFLGDGQDVTGLKPMLDELELRLRMFNRKEKLAVVGVLHTGIGAVPETLAAIKKWPELFLSAEPDWIVFKGE
ncbi:MAG: hypothetical protein AAF065_13005 [Verrucomicrobiota bacterium]